MTTKARRERSSSAMATSPAAAPPFDDLLAFRILNEIGIIDQLAQTRAARLLAPALNMSQFALLNHFARLGGEHSLVRLAGIMQVTKAAMTNTVTRLRDKGLLDVGPDPSDGRGKLVRLTPAGRQARERAVRLLARELARLDAAVSSDELATALPVLQRLRVWFDANR